MITLSVAGPQPPQDLKCTERWQLQAGGRRPGSITWAPHPHSKPTAGSGCLGLCLRSGGCGARGFTHCSFLHQTADEHLAAILCVTVACLQARQRLLTFPCTHLASPLGSCSGKQVFPCSSSPRFPLHFRMWI